uniref:Uncharacterized protein n=1 Tax=Salix viminalis TaxID=40686 RepID=A0A6N2M4Q1_SALVM
MKVGYAGSGLGHLQKCSESPINGLLACPDMPRGFIHLPISMELSDVMITVHFTAQLSDYGFTQLAEELEEVSDTWPRKPPPLPESPYTGK